MCMSIAMETEPLRTKGPEIDLLGARLTQKPHTTLFTGSSGADFLTS